MRRALFLSILILALIACNLGGPASPAATSAPATDLPAAPVDSTTAPPTVTESPEPTAAPTTIPVGSPDFWASFASPADQVWVLDPAGPSLRDLPFRLGQYYDYAPGSDSLLYATHFADVGAGPGNLAVSDLFSLQLPSGVTTPLVRDNSVVEALWMPNGADVVYVLATASTYQLRLRLANGEDRLLTEDVAFSFRPSPSGRYVAFTRETGYETPGEPGLYVIEVETGEETKISDVDKAGTGSIEDQPVWSWDEQFVLLIHFGGVGSAPILAAADGSASGPITFDASLTGEPWYDSIFYSPLWEPDNRHLIAMMGFAGEIDHAMGGPSYLVRLSLDPSARQVTAGEPIGEALQILGWQQPGDSLWILSGGSQPLLMTLAPSE